MKKRTLIATTLSLVALSVPIAGITAGTADARPREINCVALHENNGQSLYMAQPYYAEGNRAMGDDWMRTYEIGQRNYDRYCHG